MTNAQVTLAPVLQSPPDMPRKSSSSSQHHEPERPDAYSALVSMHNDEPYLPLTEAALRCHSKRRLLRAFTQAAHKPVADWLLADPARPFHQSPTLNNTLFDNSLALRATQKSTSSSSGIGSGSAAAASFAAAHAASAPHLSVRRNAAAQGPSVRPGDDLLLVPARASGGRLLGYTFGGLARPADASRACPLGDRYQAFPPHLVGRFAFDARTADLVIVVHGLAGGSSSVVVHVRGEPGSSGDRERNVFVVPAGNYGHRRLPGRLLTNVRIPERRVASMPRFQFASGSGGASSGGEAREALAALERLMKGKFASKKVCRDNFDEKSGEVLTRETRELEAEFDARDAVGMQVLRDMAVRSYFSYMSSMARESSAQGAGGSGGASSSGPRRA